ncbi:hypothetical protein FS842_004927 [Serendipita sp. 407]|nr:hypothetical protein FS842_004927 [Serendipita sp. 407]
MATQTEFVLPERYTFSKYGQPMSKTALDMIENLMKEANNCDPDAHDMYICNDYLGYAVFNIVNRVIDSIYRKAAKKQWIESWDTLTALAIFIDTFPDFMSTSLPLLLSLSSIAGYSPVVINRHRRWGACYRR